jgi:hypothetical protein
MMRQESPTHMCTDALPRIALVAGTIALSFVGLAAAAGLGASANRLPTDSPVVRQETVLDHVSPARDSVGPSPTRFAWTAVKGADNYAMGIWSEADVLVWRADGVKGTSVSVPAGLTFPPGTYFWTISALRGTEQIADSGIAAFVVREP